MTKRLLTFITLALTANASAFAQSFDIVQSASTEAADYGGGGKWGQTFVPTQTGPLVGIRLIATGRNWGASYPYGSDFVVHLHRVENGIIQNPPLASGTISKDHIVLNQPTRVDVYFDQPYSQTAGETLAFVVHETSGGGAKGWNDYALSNANPYPGGSHFSTYSDTEPLKKHLIDLTFSTITAGPTLVEQTLGIARKETGELVITLPYSSLECDYWLEESFDLQSWYPLTMKPGVNTHLVWTHQPPAPIAFYRVRSQ